MFQDPSWLVARPRVTGLAASPDGSRVVATVSRPDEAGSRYVSALWRLDPAGLAEPVRLTHSVNGESQPAFLPDGSLLFVSVRGDSSGDDDAALWCLPVGGGEAYEFARVPGGVGGPRVDRDGRVVVSGSRLPGSADDAADRAARLERSTVKTTAILHDGMPIRYWDQDLGGDSPRLFEVAQPSVDLTPDARGELVDAGYGVAVGRVVTTWRIRERRGRTRYGIALLEAGTRRLVVDEPGADHVAPALAPDGRRLATLRESVSTFDTPVTMSVVVHDLADGSSRRLDLGDVWPTELAWASDGACLYVAGDHLGRGVVLAVVDGDVRVLVDDAVYSALCPTDAGLFALRTAIDQAPTPVRVHPDPIALPSPAPTPPLPGRVERVAVDGVSGWLLTPASDLPAPVQVWVHGGPFTSWNAWSWRWCPWVAVARGHAVLLPDPALSTGYGSDHIARAWPYLARVVWDDVERLLDHVVDRPGLDASRTALLGGSFGGYMTNWIAGHTDRFDAIVTHAGLWALDQQHTTTDAADWKTGLFGRPADHPDWYAENSPHHTVGRIVTPMLIVHGNRDYRVPVSEALRLWFDLNDHFDGAPEDLPHRFLQFTGENHWVLSPANARIWYETVQGFVDAQLSR